MSSKVPPVVRAFMTHEMRDDDIAALATGRNDEFLRILDAIQRSRRASPGTMQHVVLYGSRGFGKSFMTRRVQIATAAMVDEHGPVQYILLPEEQHNLQRNPEAFLDLIAEHLKESRGAGEDIDAAFRATMFQWPKPGEEDRRWREAAARLESEIGVALDGKRGLVIVVVENFDTLLATLFKKGEDEQRLRLWLDRPDNRVMLFATATGTVDIHYDRPLFQAFESVRLSPWSPDECVEYFNRLRRLEARADLTADETAKARAIAEFIGGTPRLAQLLAEVIDTQEALTVADTMSALADRLAEYYRRRIEDLPPLSRGLLDAMIRGGEPASQTALAERVGADGQNIIARTMADLERADIIRGQRAPKGKEKLYRVTDRVFAHYYRLRQGSQLARQTPLATILDFLKSFYSRDEQLVQAFKHLEAGRSAEAGIFRRIAREGWALLETEYVKGFGKRLTFYLDGLSAAERAPILDIAAHLEEEPEQCYTECGSISFSDEIKQAIIVAMKSQALEVMGISEKSLSLINEYCEIFRGDAFAIVNCERSYIRSDGSLPMVSAEDVRAIDRLGIKSISALRVSAHAREMGQPELSAALLAPIAEEARAKEKKGLEIALLSDLGMSFVRLERYDEGLAVWARTAALAEDCELEPLRAASMAQMAIIHNLDGSYEDSKKYAKIAIDIARKCGAKEVESISESYIAKYLVHKGDLIEAEKAYARAIYVDEHEGFRDMRANFFKERAKILTDLGRFDDAVVSILEAVGILPDGVSDDDKIGVLRTALNVHVEANRPIEALNFAEKLMEVSRRSDKPLETSHALLRIALIRLEQEPEEAWNAIEEAITIGRALPAAKFLSMTLMISAYIGSMLRKQNIVHNFVEAIELARGGVGELSSEILWPSSIFVGAALAGDFDALDKALDDHGEWMISEASKISFTSIDGASLAHFAEAEGRAAGYAALAGLLPRVVKFMADVPSEKVDESWLTDLIAGFAQVCRDPELLRDAAKLVSSLAHPQAEQTAILLGELARVDESEDKEAVLARLDPDVATLIQRLRGIADPPSKPAKRSKKHK